MKFKPVVFLWLLLAIPGFAAIVITNSIYAESEKQLAKEEQIAGAFNKQVLRHKQALQDYENWKQQVERDFAH
jgi:sensor domain CHASE-containing protein